MLAFGDQTVVLGYGLEKERQLNQAGGNAEVRDRSSLSKWAKRLVVETWDRRRKFWELQPRRLAKTSWRTNGNGIRISTSDRQVR